ncbi:hypothetical protein E4U14_001289, partial [Claviceps sp. LM454 group G7]
MFIVLSYWFMTSRRSSKTSKPAAASDPTWLYEPNVTLLSLGAVCERLFFEKRESATRIGVEPKNILAEITVARM